MKYFQFLLVATISLLATFSNCCAEEETGHIIKTDSQGHKVADYTKDEHGMIQGVLTEYWDWEEAGSKEQPQVQYNYVDGQRHGLYTQWDAAGRKEFTGSYSEGRRSGEQIQYDTETGFPLVSRYFKAGKKYRERVTYFKGKQNEIKESTEYLHDKKHGDYVAYHYVEGGKNVPSVKGQFREGERYGTWTWNYPNGDKRQTIEYNKYGQVVGKERNWFESGNLNSEISYNDASKKHGEYTTYYDIEPSKSKINTTGEYNEGIRDGVWTNYYTDGVRRLRITYMNETKERTEEYFYGSGNPGALEHYKDGKLHGTYTRWIDAPGKKVKWQGNYSHGERDGTWSWYGYERGRLTEGAKVTYEKGTKIKEEPMDTSAPSELDDSLLEQL